MKINENFKYLNGKLAPIPAVVSSQTGY